MFRTAGFILKIQAHKPGSVPSAEAGSSHHLSGRVLTDGLHQPTRHDTPDKSEIRTSHSLDRGLFGLSTRKVCHASFVAIGAVGSYPAFSPFPCRSESGGVVCFLWHCLSPTNRGLPVRKYDALCCPDFPPSDESDSDGTACGGKGREVGGNDVVVELLKAICAKAGVLVRQKFLPCTNHAIRWTATPFQLPYQQVFKT